MDTDTRAPLAPEQASTASKQNSASKRPPNKPEAAGVSSRSAARRGLTARQQACVVPDKPDAGARASVAADNAASVERASITPGVSADCGSASTAPKASAGRNSASATPVSSEVRQPMSIAQAEAAASPQMVAAESSAAPASPAPAFVPRPGQAVRMCVCGAPNPESARFCYRCGQDIADVMPTAYSGDAPETADAVAADAVNESAAEAFGGALLRLCSLDGLCALDVSESCVLGRGAVLAEYLADKPYVSRRQAYLTLENGRVYIVHGGGRNPTCLNNCPLREGAPEELHPGDEIALGGMTIDGERQTMAAYFVVRRTGDSAEC